MCVKHHYRKILQDGTILKHRTKNILCYVLEEIEKILTIDAFNQSLQSHEKGSFHKFNFHTAHLKKKISG